MDDQISVNTEDLETFYAALETLACYCTAQDLAHQYQTLARSMKQSPLTRQATHARDKVWEYLQTEEENVSEELSVHTEPGN